jgi:carboxyl-terminal processing protease
MHPLRTASLAAALAVTFVMGGFILPDRSTLAGPTLFRDVVTLVSTRYIDTLDISEVYERAAAGLVNELGDPYAELFSPEDLEEFTMAYEGHYAGVGMLIESQQGAAVVLRVFPNTPAERNGVQMGDRLVSIDGELVDGWSLERVANTLKGTPGSLVEVEFRRYGVSTPLATQMTRAVVRIPAVPFTTVVEGTVGYIPVFQFNETAAREVAAALEGLVKEGVTSLVLDLRRNSGGIVEQAIGIAGLFLPAGTSVARQQERGSEDSHYVNESSPVAPDLPLVVLVDAASASASEIVAGALQDHDRAVVVGTTSYGKGLVQTAYRVEGGYVLKMTTGKWYTPSGRSIHRERTVVGGRLVEVEDSVHFATGRGERPSYHSVGGRVVYGGGGITPDLEVPPDTLTLDEQALESALLPHSPDFSVAVFDFATELKDGVEPDFTSSPEWRDELYRRLSVRGVAPEREVYDRGADYIDRILVDRVARLAFGEAHAMVRDAGNDAVLLRAIDLIRRGNGDQRRMFSEVARQRDAQGG